MKIWINKAQETEIEDCFSEAVVFDLLNDDSSNTFKSNVSTNFEEIWRRFGLTALLPIYEDLLIIAASIFTVDKRIPRNPNGIGSSYVKNDNWTRNIEISIPVLQLEKWNNVRCDLQNTLNFLSGDSWVIHFRSTDMRYRAGRTRKRYESIQNDFDCVSLFSGGLDSFSGAIKLLNDGQKTCFVGCMEYTLLNKRLLELYELIRSNYSRLHTDLIIFSVRPKPPRNIDERLRSRYTEDTSRSRSLLFIAAAIATASIIGNGVPVYIPENGFIGLNIPLTPSRKGSCSTRTTHIHFLTQINSIFKKLNIPHKVINFYAYKTKGEIVLEHKNNSTFNKGFRRTISCSHPTQGRIDGASPPINCGYCFPCLIRRASLCIAGLSDDNYLDGYNESYRLGLDFIDRFSNPDTGRAKDLKAVLYALSNYIKQPKDEYLLTNIIKNGGLGDEDIMAFLDVYKKSMDELKTMILMQASKNDNQLLEYIGMDNVYAKAD